MPYSEYRGKASETRLQPSAENKNEKKQVHEIFMNSGVGYAVWPLFFFSGGGKCVEY